MLRRIPHSTLEGMVGKTNNSGVSSSSRVDSGRKGNSSSEWKKMVSFAERSIVPWLSCAGVCEKGHISLKSQRPGIIRKRDFTQSLIFGALMSPPVNISPWSLRESRVVSSQRGHIKWFQKDGHWLDPRGSWLRRWISGLLVFPSGCRSRFRPIFVLWENRRGRLICPSESNCVPKPR